MPIAYGLVQPVELPLSSLPPELDGLRIAHLADLHVRRPRRLFDQLGSQLASQRIDLIAMTGDYIEDLGHEPAAYEVVRNLLAQLRPRLGTFGVFGNHDTPQLRDHFRHLPVMWLENRRMHIEGQPIEILGLDTLDYDTPDSIAMALNPHGRATAPADPHHRPLRLMLAHLPSCLPTAADLGVDLLLAGHTHGGQCRLPGARPLVNSCDLPLRLTAGILRHRDTLAAVSRGIGYAGPIPRFLCPPHVPLYILRARDTLGRHTAHVQNLQPW